MRQIELNRENLLTLSFHLRMLRSSVKKGLKRKYDRSELKQHMLLYDSIFDALPKLSDDIDREEFEVELSNEQFELVKEFFSWYETELEGGLSDNPTEQESTGLEMVRDIRSKLNDAA